MFFPFDGLCGVLFGARSDLGLSYHATAIE